MNRSNHFKQRGAAMLPGHLGIVITHVAVGEVLAEMSVRHAHAEGALPQDG